MGQKDKNEEKVTSPESVGEVSCAPEAKGVSFDNIPGSTSHPEELSCGGEDTAKVSLWVSFDKVRFKELAEQFEKCKAEAQESGKDSFLVLGDKMWLVGKSGFHLGKKGKRGPYYRWQLAHGGIRLGIANRLSAAKRDGAANAWLEIGSEVLMVSGGLKVVYEDCLKTLELLGWTLNANVLSEVHACVDLPEVDVGAFVDRFDSHRWISRAKRRSVHGTSSNEEDTWEIFGHGLRRTGFEFGSAIRLCVYEKLQEVKDCPTKRAIMEKVRWGGPVDRAVRVEFKARHQTLKSRGIFTVEDWEREKAGFIRWLHEDWFRMTEDEVDRTHTSRAKTWGGWEIVQERFTRWVGYGEKPPKLGMGIQVSPKPLILQSVGCLAQAMALRSIKPVNMDEFIDWSGRLLKGYSDAEDVLRKVEQKATELAAQSPTEAFFSWSGSPLRPLYQEKLRSVLMKGDEAGGGDKTNVATTEI